MSSWRCKIGWHRWSTREIHVAGRFDDRHYVDADVIDRCECGKARFAIGGATRKTCIIVPEKYRTPDA